MSRARSVEGPTISLFPFLAVLLCTMGALLVLLVLFSRSARQGADAAASPDVAELELAKESLGWRVEQLAGVRDRTASDLAAARLQLAGVEDHTRELTDELENLERLLAQLESGATRPVDTDLAALEARLASARESLDKARAELKTKPPAYAVVPYVGKNGTHRRPLYIECCIDGVFLQPEGVRLSPGDFEGPPGPGNPLACALRAAREHLAKHPAASADPSAQPYPLLLVRPSGVMAYYAAREAIQSWGSDFGYQLIDEDWTLTFPPRDPALAEVEKRAIDESRQRLAWLAEVRPVKQARPVQQFRAATTRGGVVAEGGPSVLGDQSRFDWKNQQAAAGGASGSSLGAGGGSGSGFGAGSGHGAGSGPGGNGPGNGVGPGRPLMAGGSSDGGADGDRGFGSGTGDVILGAGGGGRDGQPGGVAGSAAAAGVTGMRGRSGSGGPEDGGAHGAPGEPGGSTAGGTNRYAKGSKFGGGGGGGDGDAGGAGGGGGSVSMNVAGAQPGAGSAGGGAAGSSSGAAGGGAPQGMAAAGGPPMPGLMQNGAQGGAQAGGGQAAGGASSASGSVSIAQARGKNWASLATQDRPIPLTRPIQIECALDEFRILDDSGRRVRSRIPLEGDTATAIDPLVKAVHARVAEWGLAGERMYWKPQLVLSATADGRSRRDDLERLLADSGLDTRHSGHQDEIRNLPPVQRTSYLREDQ
ncbi:MAG: hypothetical protein ACKOEM_19815 [Planctomycetia bacterium]